MHDHAAGPLDRVDGAELLVGEARAPASAVGVVVSRFNGRIGNLLLASAFAEIDRAGVDRRKVTVLEVPGAFELPVAALRLARSGRFACVVALGCVIRGETPHFELVSGEAASGVQEASLRTGVPVSFGVLTVETVEQAEARIGTGGEATRVALEMADLFRKVDEVDRAGHDEDSG